jgi:glycine/serine hydroxymethyltransferase
MRQIAHWIDELLRSHGETSVCERVKPSVREMTSHFPVPGIERPMLGGSL